MKLRLLALSLGALCLISCNSSGDQPTKLSGKVETIEVEHLNWACDCADFIETKYLRKYLRKKNRGPNIKEEDCIFIEPASAGSKIPKDFYAGKYLDYYLKLNGQYYLDKGIPDSYEQKTELRPEKAKVFRYDSFELVRIKK